jgi:hypothetical protein
MIRPELRHCRADTSCVASNATPATSALAPIRRHDIRSIHSHILAVEITNLLYATVSKLSACRCADRPIATIAVGMA